MGKEPINERMEIAMKENGKMVNCKDVVLEYGLMENAMKEGIKTVNFMEKQSMNGLMEIAIKENLAIVKNMDMVFLYSLMELDMKESGKTIIFTVKADIHIVMVQSEKVAGYEENIKSSESEN